MAQKSVFEEIMNFVEQERWGGKFDKNTELYKDLGLYGDDAVEFLVAFGEKFDVNLSNLNFDEYFKGEGIDIISAIKSFIDPSGICITKKIMTLGDLEKAVMTGELI